LIPVIHKKIEELFAYYSEKVTGPLGLGFLDLDSGEECYMHGHTILPTASVYKIFLLVELFRERELGNLDLSETMSLSDEDKSPGTGVLYSMTSGLTLNLHDLAVLMISISDNTASDMLWRRLNTSHQLDELICRLGLKDTHIRGTSRELITSIYRRPVNLGESSEEYFRNAHVTKESLPYINGMKGNSSSACDISRMLQLMVTGDCFQADTRELLVKMLCLCQSTARIPKYLPPTVITAHKTGSVDRITNDVGIVFTEKGAYVITMLYNGNLSTPEEYDANRNRVISEEMLASISRDVYQVYIQK
jgi:beta-lactamase class A